MVASSNRSWCNKTCRLSGVTFTSAQSKETFDKRLVQVIQLFEAMVWLRFFKYPSASYGWKKRNNNQHKVRRRTVSSDSHPLEYWLRPMSPFCQPAESLTVAASMNSSSKMMTMMTAVYVYKCFCFWIYCKVCFRIKTWINQLSL